MKNAIQRQEEQPTAQKTGQDIYQNVTNAIITQLEQGTIPWQKPWKGGMMAPLSIPKNLTTGQKYRGINIPLLWMSAAAQDFTTQEWASFKQWRSKGESIAQGSRGTQIIFYDIIEKEKDGEIKQIPFVKMSYVFNRCQLASYTPEQQPEPVKPLVERLELVDSFIANTKAIVQHGGNQAFYSPGTDTITMPALARFVDTETRTATEGYYSVKLHELGHWTGHKSRLDRLSSNRFGSKPYAFEELIAELGSAFLCAELNITNAPRADHVSYLASWLQVLKEDKKAILTAASEATKLCDYLQRLQMNGKQITNTPSETAFVPAPTLQF